VLQSPDDDVISCCGMLAPVDMDPFSGLIEGELPVLIRRGHIEPSRTRGDNVNLMTAPCKALGKVVVNMCRTSDLGDEMWSN